MDLCPPAGYSAGGRQKPSSETGVVILTMHLLGLAFKNRPPSWVSWPLSVFIREPAKAVDHDKPGRTRGKTGTHPADAYKPQGRPDMVYSGDIVAVVGLKNTTTGDTLCDEKAPIVLESMGSGACHKLQLSQDQGRTGKDGPCSCKVRRRGPIKAYTDSETGQTIIAGMGGLP